MEDRIRKLFEEKGGKPKLAQATLHDIGNLSWIKGWYVNGQEIQIKLALIPKDCVSFTYGDSFPAMNYNDGKPYRGQVYIETELGEIIERYGLPQEWNPDGKGGPERYIEAQVWDDVPLKEYLRVERLPTYSA